MSTIVRRIERLEETSTVRMVRPDGLHGDQFCSFIWDQTKADVANRAMSPREARRRWHAWLDLLTPEEDRSPFWSRVQQQLEDEIAAARAAGAQP